MPGNLNERVPREHAKIPNVRNWAVRDYGNRIGPRAAIPSLRPNPDHRIDDQLRPESVITLHRIA